MTATPITIEPMSAKYNPQIGRLLVHGFRGKFHPLTNMTDDDFALFFQKLIEHFPAEPASQRMVALQEGEVIGTISVKWKPEFAVKQKQKLPSFTCFKQFGKWNLVKLMIGISLLNHKPKVGECYIADVVVHPDHRSKGVGRLLMQWAQQFAQNDPRLKVLSLHVAGSNSRAKLLYEQLLFRTQLQQNSLARFLFFKELKWHYMAMKLI